jgi:hypothetical protein
MKLKNIYLAGIGLVALTSCEEYLTVDAPSKVDNKYIFNDITEVDRLLNGAYAKMLSNNSYGRYYFSDLVRNSDIDIKTYTSDVKTNDSYARFDCSPLGSALNNTWKAHYTAIEYCNNFIYQLENSDLYSTDNEEVMQMLGEAKVLRAMNYHELSWCFGDVPFSFLPSYAADWEVMPVVGRTEMFSAIIEDLESVAPYMVFASDLTEGVERVSKEFCWSMIARLGLTAGGYSLYPNTTAPMSYGEMKRPTNYKDFYSKAAAYADSVISSGTHTLGKTYRQVFIDECNFIVDNADDPIFEIPFAQNSTGMVGYNTGLKADSYEGSTEHVWGKASGGANLTMFARYFFDDNDARKKYIVGEWQYDYQGKPTLSHSYGFYNNKWSKLWTMGGASYGPTHDGATGINFPYMRYADVLLMYAEAINELEDGVSGTNGAKAIQCLKEVRSRAFRGNESKVEAYISSIGTGKEEFLNAVLDERKLEFAGENMRWKDLVRNNKYGEALYWNFLRYWSVAENSLGSAQYEDAVIEHDGRNYFVEGNDGVKTTTLWREIENPANVDSFPNTTLKIIDIFRGSGKDANRELYTEQSETFGWGNESTGMPKEQVLYSWFGYIRGDIRGNMMVVDTNGATQPIPEPSSDLSKLPPVRYILPYPNEVILRAGGEYQNYYGY